MNMPKTKPVPSMIDPEWTEYVLERFADNELDPSGRPKVNGLRRVSRLLLGPAIRSESRVIQSPLYVSDKSLLKQPAVVEHHLTILMSLVSAGEYKDYQNPIEHHFSAAAEVHAENCEAPFLHYAIPVAATRAEAIAYRKALMLDIISAEEVQELIDDNQLNFMEVLASKYDVNLVAYFQKEIKQYRGLTRIPRQVAGEMLKGLQQDCRAKNIPSSVKGYRQDWRPSNV